MPYCPLCRSANCQLVHQDAHRPYHRCPCCRLVFVPPEYFLSRPQERAHYDLHENDPGDPRYRAFLGRLCDPLLERLAPGSRGLDFGSGPGPTLSVMLHEAGHHVAIFDPCYDNDPTVFEQSYDFVTATEVVEHLHNPDRELQRLWNCLKPGSVLGIMTKLVIDSAALADWHYLRDPTHVCFFSDQTWEWIAGQWSATYERVADDVAFFTRGSMSHDR